MNTYQTSPIKRRRRRSAAEMQSLLEAAKGILDSEDGQMTIRHLFYRLVGVGAIEKTERSYKNLCHHLTGWRRSKDIPWDSFTDNTRWHIWSQTFDNKEEALRHTAEAYRKNLWVGMGVYIEIWCEKDAIASILFDEADSFGVKVFACRGFSSLSALYDAAMAFGRQQARGREVFVYYFGDHDPSGVAIDPCIQKAMLEDFGDYLLQPIDLKRVAITVGQIDKYDLPTRPTKKSDGRAKNFEGESVEIDCMPMGELRRMVRECITQHIDRHQWEQLQIVEREERKSLHQMAASFEGGGDDG